VSLPFITVTTVQARAALRHADPVVTVNSSLGAKHQGVETDRQRQSTWTGISKQAEAGSRLHEGADDFAKLGGSMQEQRAAPARHETGIYRSKALQAARAPVADAVASPEQRAKVTPLPAKRLQVHVLAKSVLMMLYR
jgi:hypothetical protein